MFTKILRAPMDWLPDGIKGCKKAASYNFVQGAGKKGNFEIYSFFDKNGKLIKRNTTYSKDKSVTKEIFWYTPTNKRTVKSTNGCVNFYSDRTLYKGVYIEKNILPEEGSDVHRFVKFRAGQKPQEISYKTCWDGNAPVIEYKNCPRILDNVNGTEFLPVLTADSSVKRLNHIFLNQVKKQELEGIVPPLKVVTRKDAYKISNELKQYEANGGDSLKIPGFCDDSGQVYFINDIKSNGTEINNIAHEVQHARDRSDIARLEHNTFLNKSAFGYRSRAKGIIKEAENPAEYKRLSELEHSYNNKNYISECLSGNHDDLLCEYYANKKGEGEFYNALNAFNVLNGFLVS